ncbi:efflux RND transporter permease subunit [Plectonema cf. radiosum LEGE 06105]|uniref:Efflux RND transporter permease subunit n=1 Tax=Plectonema cf. radiosum LEGE 06105 TaxID=945769 RepID=A0A8J7F0B1_9CYAN|nr:efflux RND transporter permease subunit [Plectonema radiosum]MBE9213388.1 efflux RND transporter permease subunit [Plectonema cf. radiosum LEGE 06105]
MSLIKTAVRWRHGTFVLFCILALFGVLSLLSLPLELRPGGDRPEITISTTYSGASPSEVEELITRPIEERLEEVQGIQEVTSSSASGISTINLEFNWDSDIDRRLVDVLNKLQQVEALPPEAGESNVEIVSGSSSPMMWTILVAKEGFTPDDEQPEIMRSLLGALIDQTQQQIIAPLRQTLPTGFRVELAGSADVLSETLLQLASSFVLSLIITYLLLVALYRSFSFPLLIMATVPMGISGALLSLILANSIPGVLVPLDMITGLGFVILTGVVVNNAILLVDRSLQLQNEGKSYDDSLYLAVKDRLRPIFMSAGTSVLGMLPLAVIPGKGAELYQGLGIVLTGGLAFSTILTPTVVPALMGLLQDYSGKNNVETKQLQQIDKIPTART